MDNTKTNTITHLSLCTGYEGIGLGLRRVLPNIREIAYVEIEAFAIANLVNKMQKGLLDETPIFTNLKTFPYKDFLGKVSILSGGFPCQPFSQAGLKKATDDPRHLFPYIAEGIRECQPRIVFLENVEGIISSKTHEGESVLKYVLRTLEELGYRATAGIFSACEICDSNGRRMPHQRKRVFIMGYSEHNGSLESRNIKSIQGEPRGEKEEIEQLERTSNELSDSCGKRLDRRNSRSHNGRDRLLSNKQKGSEVECETQRCNRDDGAEELEHSFGFGIPSGTLGKSGKLEQTSSELGDSKRAGFESRSDRQREAQLGRNSSFDLQQHFVSRPNEPQFQWEEPRVISSESKLGGATDGTSCGVDANRNRIDRLRLLGNGVVPATAAKAFETLIKRIL